VLIVIEDFKILRGRAKRSKNSIESKRIVTERKSAIADNLITIVEKKHCQREAQY
jgi:hypothetical protein